MITELNEHFIQFDIMQLEMVASKYQKGVVISNFNTTEIKVNKK